MKQPMQPIEKDANGITRFHPNQIVRYLLDNGGLDLNKLAVACDDCSHDDWQQFYQLIGYSLSGYSELTHHVSDADVLTAEAVAIRGHDPKDARIEALEKILSRVRQHARPLAAALFAIHPEDLQETST